MPNRGDKLYDVFNGELETVTFIEQSLAAPECTIETWLVRKHKNVLARCSIDAYKTNAELAWQEYLANCKVGLINAQENINKTIDIMVELKQEILRVEKILNN